MFNCWLRLKVNNRVGLCLHWTHSKYATDFRFEINYNFYYPSVWKRTVADWKSHAFLAETRPVFGAARWQADTTHSSFKVNSDANFYARYLYVGVTIGDLCGSRVGTAVLCSVNGYFKISNLALLFIFINFANYKKTRILRIILICPLKAT